MGHTIRIYNRKNLKKTPRYNLDDPRYTGDLKTSMEKQLPIPHCNGMPLTHRSWICMGKCPMCTDPDNEPSHKRKVRKQEFKKTIEDEISCALLSEKSLEKDWNTPEEDKAWKDL